jgi:hypothetical protein
MRVRVCGVVCRCLATLSLLALGASLYAQEGVRDRDPSFAQSKKIASDLNQSTAHYGSFYLLSRFQIADLGYNEELFLPVTASSRGLTLSANAPQRLYFVPSRKSVYSVEVTPSYTWVRRSEGKNQIGWTARADAQYLLNHLYLDLYGVAVDDLRPSNAEVDSILTERRREGGAQGEIKYSTRTSLLFSASTHRITHPLDRFQPIDVINVIPLLDRHENTYRASLLHKTFPLTSIVVAVERGDYKFRNNPSRDAHRTYAGAGFIWDHGGASWRLEAGPTKIDFHNPGSKDYSGILGNTSATVRLAPRLGAAAAVARDLEFSVYTSNSYYLFDRAQVTADYSATRHLTLRVISQVGRDLYQVPVGGIFRRDRFSFNGVGWNYVVRRLQGGFDVGYYSRSSNIPDGERQHGIRVLAHLSFTP